MRIARIRVATSLHHHCCRPVSPIPPTSHMNLAFGRTLATSQDLAPHGVSFVSVNAPELVSGVSGESEQKIRDLFAEAEVCPPLSFPLSAFFISLSLPAQGGRGAEGVDRGALFPVHQTPRACIPQCTRPPPARPPEGWLTYGTTSLSITVRCFRFGASNCHHSVARRAYSSSTTSMRSRHAARTPNARWSAASFPSLSSVWIVRPSARYLMGTGTCVHCSSATGRERRGIQNANENLLPLCSEHRGMENYMRPPPSRLDLLAQLSLPLLVPTRPPVMSSLSWPSHLLPLSPLPRCAPTSSDLHLCLVDLAISSVRTRRSASSRSGACRDKPSRRHGCRPARPI